MGTKIVLLSLVQFLMPFTVIETSKSFAAFRALMRSFTVMALLMIQLMKITSKLFAAYTTGPVSFRAHCSCRFEALCQIAHLRVEGAHMPIYALANHR